MKRWVLVAALAGLTGCAVTQPLAVIGQHGDVLTGQVTATMAEGSFAVTNGTLSCTGRYNQWSMEPVLTFTTVCNDGRQGFGSAVRDSSLEAGQGSVHLDDGETAAFIFGPAAATFSPKIGDRFHRPTT